MVFSSYNFIFLFFTILMVLYFLIPQRWREGRNLLLLAFSLFFYAYSGLKFLPIMLISIAINYVGGLLAAPGRQRKRLWLFLTVAANLALLGWFKYANFVGDSLAAIHINLPIPEVVLPIGISFFTFQGMSYVIDVSRGEAEPERNPLRVALYVALFPQLVAGPIVRYTTIADEIVNRKETLSDFSDGAVRFIFGLAKKLVLANGIGILSDQIYAIPAQSLTVTLAWLGPISHGLQLYFDFSGYSDMAIGLGQMFGFHFLENFNYPFISKSVSELWRRWHISLSSWFRDYVYIPLGGSHKGRGRQIFNLVVVWALTGLWHGAAWNFVLWGLFFCVLLMGERFLWGKALKKLGILGNLYTLVCWNLSLALFRGDSVGYATGMIKAMLGGAPFMDRRTTYFLLEYGAVLLLGVIASLPIKVWLQSWLQARADRPVVQLILIWGPKLLSLGLLAVCYVKLVSSTFNPFIYFRF